MASLPFLAGASLIAFAALPASAAAQDFLPSPIAQTVSELAPAAPSVAQTQIAPPFENSAVTEDTLGSIAGREDTTQISRAEQTSQVSRNSIGDNSRTGDARIADNAFQNLSGLSILNVNTGNNVAINAAMNVNISINPVP